MRRKNGFTLIELLVVVAIIAVLIAILLPALANTRNQAKSVICMSNEKQISMAFLQYANDWNDSLPTTGYYPNNLYPSHCWDSWINLLSEPYLRTGAWDDDRKPSPRHDFNSPNAYYGLKQSSVWLCPNDPTGSTDGKFNGPTYGVNRHLTGWYNSLLRQTPYRISEFQQPLKTPLMLDVPGDHWGGYPSHALEGHTIQPFFAHLDKGGDNFLFVDGHVQWIPRLEPLSATPATIQVIYSNEGEYFVADWTLWY